ncbi:hypothetical protein, partial [Elizabethkingia meningoseptica]|uniref:hypothetical protein n=1 Tax=Elizabethkingia meningoseptica TaxID=238 RepID=UPI0031597C93
LTRHQRYLASEAAHFTAPVGVVNRFVHFSLSRQVLFSETRIRVCHENRRANKSFLQLPLLAIT